MTSAGKEREERLRPVHWEVNGRSEAGGSRPCLRGARIYAENVGTMRSTKPGLCYLLRISGIYPLPSLQAAASPVQAPSPHQRHRSASIPFHPPLSSSPGSSQRNLRNLFKVNLITARAFSQPQIPRPDSVFLVLRYFVQGLEHGGGTIRGPIPMDAEGRLDVSCSQAPLFLIALNSP